jgi:hypothetical protein
MKILKKITAFLIDIVLLIFLSIFICTIMSNSLGAYTIMLFTERDVLSNLIPLIIIFVSLSTVYFVLAGFNKWTTIGRILVCQVDKKTANCRSFYRSLSAWITDFSFMLILSYLIDLVINQFLSIRFFHLFFFVFFAFHLLSGFMFGKTIGKMNSGIGILGKNKKLTLFQSLKREILFKFGLVFLLPGLVFYSIGIVDPFNIFIDIFCVSGIIVILYFVFKGKLWWNSLSGTKKEFMLVPKSRLIVHYFFSILLLSGLLLLIWHSNNKLQDPDEKVFGFNYPLKYAEYPTNAVVKEYANFLAAQNKSPKEYILGLFDKYDIVVLCESYHMESTQWELITELVGDKRFIEKVGHVFTEYGSSRHQNKLDTFLIHRYTNETELEKATASIMEYMTGGFYYFLKSANKVNSTLPDSMKLHVHFTDVLNWDYLAVDRFYEKNQNLDDRDKLMAKVTIDWFRDKLKKGNQKKCLVVTNTCHAFGYAGGVERLKKLRKYHVTYDNQGQYIYKAFPMQTACVFENSINNKSRSLFMPIYMPIHDGIWDKAFKLNQCKAVGFDLKDSPFGKDDFDFHLLFGAKSKLIYQDIFTGVIFNIPYDKVRQVDYPYKKYAIEMEYKQKHPGTADSLLNEKVKEVRWENFRDIPEIYPSKSLLKGLNLTGILSLKIVLLFACLCFIVLTINFIIRLIQRQNYNNI